MRELSADPSYVRNSRAREQIRSRARTASENTEALVLQELAALGFDVSSISQLMRLGSSYQSAIPTLITWIERLEDVGVKEAIVRTLSVPFAASAGSHLVREFRAADTDGLCAASQHAHARKDMGSEGSEEGAEAHSVPRDALICAMTCRANCSLSWQSGRR